MVAVAPHAEPLDALLATLARRRAVVPLAALPGRLAMDADDVADLLDLAVEGGRVELWPDCPAGPAAMLSSLEASRRGLVLDGGHEQQTNRWRWVRPGQLRPLRAAGLTEPDAADDAGGLARTTDPRPPARRGSLADRWAAVCDRLGAGDPVITPTLLLGIGLTWPVERRPDRPCPGCLGRALGTLAVCLICHRSGADHLFKPIPKALRPKAYRPGEGLAGGRGTSKGKAGRKAEGKAKGGEGRQATSSP